MTKLAYKTHPDGSINYKHYTLKGSQAKSEAMHELLGGISIAIRAKVLTVNSNLIRLSIWSKQKKKLILALRKHTIFNPVSTGGEWF